MAIDQEIIFKIINTILKSLLFYDKKLNKLLDYEIKIKTNTKICIQKDPLKLILNYKQLKFRIK